MPKSGLVLLSAFVHFFQNGCMHKNIFKSWRDIFYTEEDFTYFFLAKVSWELSCRLLQYFSFPLVQFVALVLIDYRFALF